MILFACATCTAQAPAPAPLKQTQTLKPAVIAQTAEPAEPAQPDPRLNMPDVDARPSTFRRGVSLGLFASTKDVAQQHKIYNELLDEIVEVGATDLSLVVRWQQTTVEDTTIAAQPGLTAPDALLEWVIKQANARGLRVFLMPILHIQQREMGVWRGTLKPAQPKLWWRAYTRFILHYARMSARTNVELFAVGSELLSLESQRDPWLKLIKQVRAVYKGKLTYSSNWDHFEVVSFWDKVNLVGMTAYHELSDATAPNVETLRKGWRGFQQRLKFWAMVQDHEYMFTEIGYPSHSKGAAHPWDYRPQGTPAPMLQARAYRAMVETWHNDPKLQGVYVWNWFGFKSATDRGYTPRGKPAYEILEHWYKQSRKLQIPPHEEVLRKHRRARSVHSMQGVWCTRAGMPDHDM